MTIIAKENNTLTPSEHIDLAAQTAPAQVAGRVWYDTDDKALSYYNDITGTSNQIGLETWARVRNTSGATITNGSVVKINGATGQIPTITKASATTDHSHTVLGVVTADIANNAQGLVTVLGLVKDLDLSAYTDGQTVYLSTVAGALTATPPTYPDQVVAIGIVAHAHATQGRLFVRPADAYHAAAADALRVLKAGDTMTGDLLMASGAEVVFNKAAGNGIKLDTTTPVYGWKDLIGDITPKTTGVGAPTLDTIQGSIRGFRYSAGDDGDIVFHVPHDYVPGTDLYLHPHWTHNGTNISGSLVITYYATYAKGHQQAAFPAEVTGTITDGSLNITNTPQYYHRIPEVQFSTAGGSASQLNTNDIEVDGIILIHYDVTTIPTITGGSGEPFLLTFDLHYQSTGIPTKNKSPSFYV